MSRTLGGLGKKPVGSGGGFEVAVARWSFPYGVPMLSTAERTSDGARFQAGKSGEERLRRSARSRASREGLSTVAQPLNPMPAGLSGLRNRFPADFMFQLNKQEAERLRFQAGTSNPGRGGRRYLPYVFTEQGVAMLSSVLRSKQAVQVNIAIMRAFVRLREILATHKERARKLEELEQKYDAQFKVVFDAIRQLMTPAPAAEKRRIGFHASKASNTTLKGG